MLLEFNEAKSAKNLKDRGIGFERFDIDAETAVSVEDLRKNYGERRLRVPGFVDGLSHAAVVTPRGEKIGVISLRRTNQREEGRYAKERQSS